ncbi:assimilatory sulfite reductase (NADPH) hemoprotein subunit [Porticoccus sp. GXU_MW_L64]
MSEKTELAPTEGLKERSRHLRGTLVESLGDAITGAIREEDLHILKHHGTYQQDDRDMRNERRKQFLEPAYSFMIRARMPGGVCTPEQWLAMDDIAQQFGNNTLRLTTRQTFQFHGVVKDHLKPTFQRMHSVLVDAIAACGDVNRNVMCNPNPVESQVHEEVYQWAVKISEHLLPNTNAYAEVWLDGEKVDVETEKEPIYGDTYLPRKYKTVVAVPPYNDVDIYAHDMGFIAIIEAGELKGFNITVGGGLGMTHGDPETFARLADLIGFCTPDQVLEVSEKILTIQRDYGDRVNRRLARFKYTIAKHGIEWFKKELNERLGYDLQAPRPFEFISNSDRYGWVEGYDGRWHLNLFIENGRIKDGDGLRLMTGLREVAKVHRGDFRITPNQNIIIANIAPEKRPEIEALVEKYELQDGARISAVRRNSMACVAFPTCSLAMAESERYLPSLVTKVEQQLADHGLQDEEITVRMQGCPNGCGRAVLAQIGFIGKGPGKYNMYLGAGRWGQRFSALYLENIDEAEILAELDALFGRFAAQRQPSEPFGDFVIRAGIVAENTEPSAFHSEMKRVDVIEVA